jgi:uncharacterized protein (DUF885 family)
MPRFARSAFTCLLCLSGALGSASAASPTDSHPAWSTHVQQFLADYFTAHPGFAVFAGKHEFDGQIADFSEAALTKEIKRLHAARTKTAAFTDSQLSKNERFERDYLIAQIEGDLFWLEVADQPHTAPFWYADALDPDVYITREYAPLETRIAAYTKFAGNVPRALDQIKANLKLPLARTAIKIGHRTIGGLADFFAKDIPAVFSPVKDEHLQADFKAANDPAIKAIREFDAWLTVQEATANGEFALGAEKFSQMLKMTEQVDIPLGRLEAIGQRDVDRNLAALDEACKKFAPGKTPAECIALVEAHKADDADPVAAARKQLTQLRKFIVDNNVVTVPGSEEAEVRQAPAYKAWNFAFINIPGPYEKGLPSIYYISPADPTWSKAKQEAYIPGRAGLLFTSAHEVYPGHFVQFLHAHRVPSEIGQLFIGYAFSEGWAHYCEEMVYEEGLGSDDPEHHIAQIHEALLRNVRFISAIGLHTHGMTVEESKRLFIEKAFQDEGNAEQQALRGTFDPAYLNYTLGKLMIRKLRDDWCGERGGKKAWKQFHDEFLNFGGPPIPLIRRAMLGPNDNGSLF